MGLMVHSIARLPMSYEREYYVYILDYGWKESLGRVLTHNFDKMAGLASVSKAVVIRGTVGSHFEDEVLSWHHFNGQPADELLPAILITTQHPAYFQKFEMEPRRDASGYWSNEVLLLIPIRRCCSTTDQVVELIEKIFIDIKAKKALANFRVAEELHAGENKSFIDALILEPSIGGVGVDLKALGRVIKKRISSRNK